MYIWHILLSSHHHGRSCASSIDAPPPLRFPPGPSASTTTYGRCWQLRALHALLSSLTSPQCSAIVASLFMYTEGKYDLPHLCQLFHCLMWSAFRCFQPNSSLCLPPCVASLVCCRLLLTTFSVQSLSSHTALLPVVLVPHPLAVLSRTTDVHFAL